MNTDKNDMIKESLPSEQKMDLYWTHRSASYSQLNRRELRSRERHAWEALLFDGVEERRPLHILDIGAGPGFFSILCAGRGHIVTAADMNAEMIKQAEENARAAGADIRFVQVGHTLPFARESFDVIVSRNVTWALPQPEAALRAWGALLRKGGLLRYFDAEWYNYLAETPVSAAEIRLGSYSRANEMEKLALSLPMTYRRRPKWDRAFWQAEGFTVDVRENLNPLVYSREDQEYYRNFPLFMASVSRK